jgi:tight adherence protein B
MSGSSRWVARIVVALACLGVVLVGWRAGPVLAVAAAAVFAVGAVLVRDVIVARADASRRAELRRGVRVLVAELEAGALPARALAASAEVAPYYSVVLRAAGQAAAVGDDAAAVLCARDETRPIGLAWTLGQDAGAPLAEVLGRVADDLSAAEEQYRAVAVALSGPRSSAVMLAGLPVVGIALGASMGAQPLTFLGGRGAGQLVCCVGVLLDGAGLMWMRRILRSAQGP